MIKTNIDNKTSKNFKHEAEHDTLHGIQRYYTRTQQGEYANNYFVEPRETCPLDVLNDSSRFVIVTFDKMDNYLVIGGKRYYLNRFNSIKCTDHVRSRLAVIDLHELKAGKAYDFDEKFAHRYTARFKDFDELETLARQQYAENGCPYFKQIAQYIPTTKRCNYFYEPSFDLGSRAAI